MGHVEGRQDLAEVLATLLASNLAALKDEDEQLIWVNERVQYARRSPKYDDLSVQSSWSSDSHKASLWSSPLSGSGSSPSYWASQSVAWSG